MALHDIVGQERAIRILQQALTSARLAQAYLFYGPSGTGKKLTAYQFTKALYCSASTTDACDQCVSCRKIDAGNHPDVLSISVEGSSLGIEHIRTIQHRLSYKPYEHQRITVILDGCELLTAPAANALLKTLEEPPECALLILLSGHRETLPLTLTSRCQLVPFQSLSPTHMHALLTQQGFDEATVSLATALSEGRLDVFTPGDITQSLSIRNRAYSLLVDLTQAEAISSFLQARKLAGKRDQCEALLHWLTLLCRDLIILKTAPDRHIYNRDLCHELTALAPALPIGKLLEAFDHLQQQRHALSMNLNPQLIFEHVLIHLQHLLTTAHPSRAMP